MAVAVGGIIWKQNHKPTVSRTWSGDYSTVKARPDFPPVPPPVPGDLQKQKSNADFEKALQLAEKKDPLKEIPAESASAPAKNRAADGGGGFAGAGSGEAVPVAEKKADAKTGEGSEPQMDDIQFLPKPGPAAAAAKAAETVKPVAPRATPISVFGAGGGGGGGSGSSGGGASASTFRGPDLPELGAQAKTPTPTPTTTEGSKATASNTPDPRIPESPFSRQPAGTPSPVGRPQQPGGRQ